MMPLHTHHQATPNSCLAMVRRFGRWSASRLIGFGSSLLVAIPSASGGKDEFDAGHRQASAHEKTHTIISWRSER
jgi:hypothetical protein